MNFHRNTNSDKRSTRVNHHAKAPSARSIQATGNSRGLFRRALATRAARSGSKGTGAPAKLLGLLAVALVALFAAAAPASAAPPATVMGAVSNVSYTTADVTGKVTTDGSGFFGETEFVFEYSTDETNWSPGAAGRFALAATEKSFDRSITGLEIGTKYFVRLTAYNATSGGPPEEVHSPGPNPSFTTLIASPPTIPGPVEATDVFSTSAKGTAQVNRPADSDNVECHFEYVSDAEFTENPTGEEFAGATVRPCADPIEAAGTKAVTAPLGCPNPVLEDSLGECLKPATTYHLRLVAENAAPGSVTKEAASTFTTGPPVAKPAVLTTNDATDVGKNTAKVSGEVQRPAGADPALDVNCRFEYVTDEQFTANPPGEEFAGAASAPCAENPITSPAPGYPAVSADVSAELSGLSSGPTGTTYHLRLVAENGGGTDTEGAAGTFTTLPVVPPTFTVDSITEIGYSSFRVTGTGDPGNQGTLPLFEYSPVGAEEWIGSEWGRDIATMPAGSAPEEVTVKFPLSLPCFNPPGPCMQPLKPGTTYQVRLGGSNVEDSSFNYSPEPYPEFTTKGTSTPPSATFSVSGVTGTSAHFSGTIDTHAPAGPLPDEAKDAYKTDWHFECTPACPPNQSLSGVVEAEEGSKAISADAIRLEPDTEYQVKLVAHNSLEAVEPVEPFKTLQIPPSVKQTPGTSDGTGGYTLQGVVNPNNHAITGCKFEWGPNAPAYAFSADCSPLLPSPGAKPTTVEAHLTGLNTDVDYHALLVVTYGTGLKADSGEDQKFKATLSPKEPCPANEQLRIENNSLALPECRAYEMVTSPGKEGFGAVLWDYSDDNAVNYRSEAGNIAKSGENALGNLYTAVRSGNGWKTVPNLNGSSGTLRDAPSYIDTNLRREIFYSPDFLSSIWTTHRKGDPEGMNYYLRGPDGAFTLIGSANSASYNPAAGGGVPIDPGAVSADLSHFVVGPSFVGSGNDTPTQWGPGVYEFVGTGVDVPRRVDLDNSGAPISTCPLGPASALANTMSADGSTIVFTVNGGCGGANPPAQEVWARVNATTSFDVSASQCHRVDCNAPARATFAGAAKDGSRVFFMTTQQLLDGDTDQTNDLYACDIPTGNPAPIGDANSCASLKEVSGASTGAEVDPPSYTGEVFQSNPGIASVSEDGSTVYFLAKGVLADNEDAFKEKALAGDHNLYVWHADAAHPDGQTSFVSRLDSNDIGAQSTPDGRYLVFTTASQLVDTDTDSARDVYRYDADTGELTRVSTNVFGVAGNGDDFDAGVSSNGAVSDNGQKIVFTTTEALSAADGNGEPDAYLRTPARVSLVSSGSVGGGVVARSGGQSAKPGNVTAITASGLDLYFQTAAALTPADTDDQADIYDARIGGGFSFAEAVPCSGEACQPSPSAPPAIPTPATGQLPADPGNVRPKACLKGKVAKGKKCVRKKKHKKHSGSGTRRHGKKAAHKPGGGK
jgi:hypothetical protein